MGVGFGGIGVGESKSAVDHRAKVRQSLAKIDPGLLPFLDAARERFGTGTRLEGVQGQIDGVTVGAGRMGPSGDLNAAVPRREDPQ